MSKNIRRFAIAVSVTLILTTTPAIAAPSRDGGGDRDRTSIVHVLKRLAQRLFGLTPTDGLIGPIPAPAPTPQP